MKTASRYLDAAYLYGQDGALLEGTWGQTGRFLKLGEKSLWLKSKLTMAFVSRPGRCPTPTTA